MFKRKIILVSFPYDDISNTKLRPALCLTEPIGKYNHLVIAAISSKIPSYILETDIILNKKDSCFTGTGLKVDSIIRLNRLLTISKKIIKKELGSLEEKMQKDIDKKLKKLFKL